MTIHDHATNGSGAPADSELIRVGEVLGNESDPDWADRLSEAHLDLLLLDQWEAQKSRLRRFTTHGAEIAVSLDRGVQLRDGDVLVWDEDRNQATIARIALKDVMVVEVDAVMEMDPQAIVQTCIELGHAIGNQHWPTVVKGTKVFVPLTVDHAVMSSVMKTHAFEGVTYTFTTGEEVIPYLAPHESRRLFGGAEPPGTGHSHGPGHPGH